MGTLRTALGGGGLAVALMATALAGHIASGQPAATAPATAQNLPTEVRNGVVIGLPDGDRFKVTTSRDLRTVWGTRFDGATGTWGERRAILRERRLFCGDVDARAAGGAVAVIAECDRGGYAEDQAPTSSHALYSADTVGWRAFELPGEAHEEPGISPGGTAAVWPLHQGYVTWTPAEGFVHRTLATKGQEYTLTAVVDDAGKVSLLYGATVGEHCGLVALTWNGEPTPLRQELSLGADVCGDVSLVNVDATTVLFGEVGTPSDTWTISRETVSSPWAVTAIAPRHAPGLEDYRPWRTATLFFSAPGVPLVALGSHDRERVLAQAYDEAAQRWRAPVEVHHRPGSGCHWGDNWTDRPLAVVAAVLECDRRRWVLATTDAATWHSLPMHRHPLGVSSDGSLVAVPSKRATAVLSREQGVVRLPAGATGRCDVVVPASPDSAVRLTARGRHRGWPTVLQQSTSDGWRRLDGAELPTYAVPCFEARAELYEPPYAYAVHGRDRGYFVRFLRDGDAWEVRKLRW